jgi:probable rRNA maturation factor
MVDIDNRQVIVTIGPELYDIIKGVVREALALENFAADTDVSISLVDNDEIRDLNRTYRGVDSPTDVLSFPMLEGEDNIKILDMPLMLGDIVISLERAREQCKDYGHSFEREAGYLTAHGMLHLMGYDHQTEEDKKIMRQKEECVLEKLKLRR